MSKKTNRILSIATGLIVTIAFVLVAGGGAESESVAPNQDEQKQTQPRQAANPENAETAVLAGGCFWGVEAVFERLHGVIDVQSGYSGGDESTASYYTVTSGRTGHAESVEIVYDPEVIDYEVLLDVFFSVAHDPTQLNYQGPDHGPQYRSAIFFSNPEQERVAKEFIEKLEDEGSFRDPIVTEVAELDAFYPAEDYHQDFMERNPSHPYIVYWDIPKIDHLEKTFPELLADQND